MREDWFGKCDNCKAKTPLTDLQAFEKKWFMGLLSHEYHVCKMCYGKLMTLRGLGMI